MGILGFFERAIEQTHIVQAERLCLGLNYICSLKNALPALL